LRLAVGLEDLKVLSAAVAEVAARFAEEDPHFKRAVQDAYQDLLAAQKTRPLRQPLRPSTRPQLTPVGSAEGFDMGPGAPLNPKALLALYGAGQLRTALEGYSLAALKGAATEIEASHPDTKPKNRGRKDDVIDYIVAQVAGDGY
jgi:hypothetical protein